MKKLYGPAIALIVMLAAGQAVAATEEITAAAADERCCFANPSFAGICQVTPGEDETCASILAYLNNPNSVGRSYCGKTKIRGGWTQVDCEGETAASTAEVCSQPSGTE